MVRPVTVGLDNAKNVFTPMASMLRGRRFLSRKLRRGQVEAFFAMLEPCLVGNARQNPVALLRRDGREEIDRVANDDRRAPARLMEPSPQDDDSASLFMGRTTLGR